MATAPQLTEDRKTDLKSLTPGKLQQYCTELGLQRFRADQLAQWMYQKKESDFSRMTNLSKELREKLEESACIRTIEPVFRAESADGTIKFLYRLHDGHRVEAVLIPDFDEDGQPKRMTVCISSQVGCVFGCSFCATGKMGFFRNLTCGEIADQAIHINDEAEKVYGRGLTNIVYMGMGEPLHNYESVVASGHIITSKFGLGMSPKRLTISTVGLGKQIRQYGEERQPFNLALSLHAATDEKRDQIMPINASMNLNDLREALKYYHEQTGAGVTYEYLLFDHFNDEEGDARELARISRWIPSKVNIIMYNNVEGVELQRAKEERLDRFMKMLTDQDVLATVRRSRGDDIDAGCGQLAIRDQQKKGKSLVKN